MQSSGLCYLSPTAFLVLLAQWSHSDPIPNSVVKRCCGEDTWRVAAWENSSVPGYYFTQSPFILLWRGFELLIFLSLFGEMGSPGSMVKKYLEIQIFWLMRAEMLAFQTI